MDRADSSTPGLLLGFCNPKFSDCQLSLHFEQDSCLPRGFHHSAHSSAPRVVPASTLVLAARSRYFSAMFDGSFSESTARGDVHISLPSDGKEAFMELVRFMYSGSLQDHFSSNFEALLRLLVLADKFDVPDCTVACIDGLHRLSPLSSTPDALLLLSLPPPILNHPNSLPLTRAAKEHITRSFGHLLLTPGQPEFLALPEQAMMALLESDSVPISSEHHLVSSAKKWVLHQYPDERSRHEALCRIVVPRVRFLALSPKDTREVCSWWAEAAAQSRVLMECGNSGRSGERDTQSSLAFRANGDLETRGHEENNPSRGCVQEKHSEEAVLLASCTEGCRETEKMSEDVNVVEHTGNTEPPCRRDDSESASHSPSRTVTHSSKGTFSLIQCAALSSAVAQADRAISDALVAFAEDRQLRGGVLPPLTAGTSSEASSEGVHHQRVVNTRSEQYLSNQPRLSDADPTEVINLHIPHKLAVSFHFRSYLAATAPMLVGKRWFVFKARVEPVSHVLTLALAWEPSFSMPAESSPFKLRVRFCMQTSLTHPGFEQLAPPAEHVITADNPEAVLVNALKMPWVNVHKDPRLHFPDGAMKFRADVWVLKEEPHVSSNGPLGGI